MRNVTQAVAIVAVMLVYAGNCGAQAPAGTASKPAEISEAQATEIALKAVPGEVTSVSIERKSKKDVYVVEIIAKSDGVETDVFVDLKSGKVVGTDK